MTTTVRLSTPPISPRVIRMLGTVGDYVALTKPRIVELLLVTTVPAMMLAAHGLPGLGLVLVTIAGGSLAAGSANALNCYLDRDIDAIMLRTRARPLNRSAVSPRAALVFGFVLGVASVVLLWRETNPLSAELAAGAIAFYVVVYTGVLKRRTSSNIVWGGAAGCMPVLIGWSAVTDHVSWSSAVLFLIIFLWTPPHFWALAMRYRSDYEAAGVPMLPVVATSRQVAVRIVAYSWAMVAASLALWPIARTTLLYPIVAAVAGGVFLRAAHGLHRRVRRGEDPRPMVLFHWSITYLSVLFVGIAADALLGQLR